MWGKKEILSCHLVANANYAPFYNMYLYGVQSQIFEPSMNSSLQLHEAAAQELYKRVPHSLSVAGPRLRLKPSRCLAGALSHPAACFVFNLSYLVALFRGRALSIWKQGPGWLYPSTLPHACTSLYNRFSLYSGSLHRLSCVLHLTRDP